MTKRKKKPQKSTQPILLPAAAASLHYSVPTRNTRMNGLSRVGFAAVSAAFFVLIAVGLSINTQAMTGIVHANSEDVIYDHKTYDQFRKVTKEVSDLTIRQEAEKLTVTNPTELEQELSIIQIDIEGGRHAQAVSGLGKIQQHIDAAKAKLDAAAIAPIAPVMTRINGLSIPILMYHNTPANFDAQLSAIEQKGYHTVTMQQVGAALRGEGGLPTKPVAITFDDGFANQIDAFHLLQSHHMVATYYIISGGERSKWCIGASRRYGDPLQPAGGCGDIYLSWGQVSELDHSGTIEIGGHTVDHENLASDTVDAQRFEIFTNKRDIEQHLGHPIQSFAYPYGAFNGAAIQLTRDAGYTTAVTTLPGISQSLNGIYTLHRIREVSQLP
jgi:peptidoglycan/xylan/chitin deacetylase (PgdA/CDA1 family)